MKNIDENRLLKIIKFTPSIFILIITIVYTSTLTVKHKNDLENEKRDIESKFIENEKRDAKSLVNTLHQSINNRKNSEDKNLKYELKNEVTNAYIVAYRIFNKYKNLKSKEEITNMIKNSLRDLRYLKGRAYHFVYTQNGISILDAKFPEVEGSNIWNHKDSKGLYLIQETSKIVESKIETYFNWYEIKNENKKIEYKKLGFFKKFEPYNWIIASSEYLVDFENIIKQEVLTNIKSLKYKDKEHVFVLEENGEILSNKYLALSGKSIYQQEETKHLKELSEKNKKELENGIFISHDSNKYKKISYLKLVKDWNWIIGISFNIKDIESVIKEKQNILEKKYNAYLMNSFFISGILILILLAISVFVSMYIEKIFYKYKTQLEKKQKTLIRAQRTAQIGDWNLDVKTMKAYFSKETLNILGLSTLHENKNGYKFLKKLISEENWQELDLAIKNAMKNEDKISCLFKIKRGLDKEIAWIDIKGKFNSTDKNIYGTIQDITDRKKIEIEKEEKETLLYRQSKMAAMGEMISNIAHQWRQPLSAISTASTGTKIQKEMGSLSDKELFQALDGINNSAQYLSQTIEDFRLFFSPSENKISEFKISNTLKKTLNLISAQFAAKDIEIIKNIEEMEILSLENELIQVLVNLLNNSRDALLNIKGRRLIFIDISNVNNSLLIEIYDNGKGIQEDIIDRIFEPYFTTKHQSQGTGIGLYMTQEIITKLLNGTIEVKNSTFTYENIEYKGGKFSIKLSSLSYS